MNESADSDRTQLPASITEAELIEAIEGRRPDLGRSQALKELGRRRSPRTTEVFTRVLTDSSVPSPLRTIAAIELGKMVKAEHQQALISTLGAEDPFVLRRVVEAIGRIGDREALQRLESLPNPSNQTVSRSLEFAKALTSYRLGLGIHQLTPPADTLLNVDPTDVLSMRIDSLDPPTLRGVIPELRRELPAIEISENDAVQISCDTEQFWLIFNQDINQAAALPLIRQRNAVLAVLMQKAPCVGDFFIYEYLLTQPNEQGNALVFGIRPTGTMVHFGQLELSGESSFQLRALNTVYSPAIDIVGQYSLETHQLTFTRAQVRTSFDPMQVRPATPQKLDIGVR
jgi:hypothetical protein